MRKSNPSLAAKYFPRNRERKKIDTVKSDSFNKNHDVLTDAFIAWTGLDSFRKMAERNKQYTFGDQWNDKIPDPNGCEMISERQHILNQNSVPLQNNRIRGIVRSVNGVFQSTQTEPVCVSRDRDEQSKGEIMSSTIQYVYQLNKLWGLDGNAFTNFLVTGLAAFRSSYSYRNGKMDVWTDIVNHNRIFFDNHMEDPRHWDCHLIGQIWDVGLYDAMANFSGGDRNKALLIRDIYHSCDRGHTVSYAENYIHERARKYQNFFIADDETRCRVIEVWKKESKERLLVHDWMTGSIYKVEIEDKLLLDEENRSRIFQQSEAGVLPDDMKLLEYKWFIDNYWYFYYMSPYGDVLMEGESPFWHESHPYSFRIYPFFDGQVFPFVSDFIDQQRYINRLLTLQDFIVTHSAKGVLAIHEDSIPEGWSPKRFANEWARVDGVIIYTGKSGCPAPKQIVENSTHMGVSDMLSIQLKLLEDISGVQGALQGQSPRAGTPAALYMQQTQNSATSLTELFDSFRGLREERDMKNMKLIQQYYTDPRYININGTNARPDIMLYDPNTVRNAEFDLSITESSATPVYRLIMNDFLMQLFQAQAISVEDLLQNGSFPFADKLLQSIRSRSQQMQRSVQATTMGNQVPLPEGPVVPEDITNQINNSIQPITRQIIGV